MLQDERLSHRISLPDLSKRTRIRQEYLEALEKNQFDKLPAATFVKGYVKIYAQLFGFDPEPLLALLRRDYKESAKGKLVPRDFLTPVLKKRRHLKPVTFVMIGFIVVFVTLLTYISVQWWMLQRPPELSITQPEDFAKVGPQVTVRGETRPEAIVVVNDQPVALQPDGSFETEVSFMTEGILTIIIEATDDRGKTSTVQKQVQVEF
ncbi:MAG: cytoskeleton protein RodZ [Patescibacteria group bacterium]|nr:cytoskeleton protein RodZ [Patescibacteria group bacterium]